MGRKVFISGPIHGVEDRQNYRVRIRNLLLKYGYEPIDPWQREKKILSSMGTSWWKERSVRDIIEKDLMDIEECDILVAYLPKLSAGTCMELFYAYRKGKKTIVICEMDDPSPWIITRSNIIVRTFEELEEVLKEKLKSI